MASPRFGDADAPKVTKESKAIQTAINDTARTILGARRTDRIRVEDLLARSGLPAYNHLVIRSIAMETWKALNICDGPNGSHNPIGCMLRNEGTRSKHTRRVESGKLPPPTKKPQETFICHAVRMWNAFADLRDASTLSGARRVASTMARMAPL